MFLGKKKEASERLENNDERTAMHLKNMAMQHAGANIPSVYKVPTMPNQTKPNRRILQQLLLYFLVYLSVYVVLSFVHFWKFVKYDYAVYF